jgi:hypothetical protein
MTGRVPAAGNPARFLFQKSFFLLLALSVPPALRADVPSELVQRAHALHLAERPYWRRLLHYRRGLLGFNRSEVDDPKFFLSKRGARDPSAELDADLRGFFDPAPADADLQHPQCLYPARYAWLKEQLHFAADAPAEQPCPRFQQWYERMDADSLSIVFASYYMNNPASMYGHSFLRLNRKGDRGGNHLLDYVVNYAADSASNNGVLFAVLGLTGGYQGRFSTLPYYMKVQEYNNLESRDLWEYDLRFTPEQVNRLLRHLWEMGNGAIPYFFLNRNCSYQLLPLLEVAAPDLNLSSPFIFKAIPMDTLRKLIAQPGMVTKVSCRPAPVRKLVEERAGLSKAESNVAADLAKAAHPASFSVELSSRVAWSRQALVLDTAYDYFRYRAGFKRPLPEIDSEREQELLLLRNKLGTETPSVSSSALAASTQVPGVEQNGAALSPDHGHATGRIGVSYGFSNRSHFEELSLRPAIHDPDDPPLGYIPGSQLQMFLLRLRYDDDRKTLYPQQFTLVDLASFSPWDAWVHHPSWKVNTGLEVADDLPRDPENSLYWGLGGGSGLTVPIPFLPQSMFYALAVADGGIGHPFRDVYRLGGGGVAGLTFQFFPGWRHHIEGGYIQYPLGDPGSTVQWRAVESFSPMKNFDLRATLERKNQYKEVLLSALWYL